MAESEDALHMIATRSLNQVTRKSHKSNSLKALETKAELVIFVC
jgi:hypothetical protein